MAKKKKEKQSKKQKAAVKEPVTLDSGVRSMKDLMAPASIDRSQPDHLNVEGKFVRSYLISGFPKAVQVGWLDSVFNYDGDLDVAMHIIPMDERAALDQLTEKITQYRSQLDMDIERGNNRNYSFLRAKIEDLEEERARIEQNYISMFQTQIAMNLYTDSLEQLNKEGQLLSNTLKGRKIQLMPTYLRQDKGYKTALPYGTSWLNKQYRNLSSDALTACFPFYVSEISHQNGTFVGVNLESATPIYIDFFNRKLLSNGSTSIFGKSGSGKTFLVCLIILRSVLEGVHTGIVDVEGDFNDIAKTAGGVSVVISDKDGMVMNPFDLEVTEIEDEDGKKTRTIELRDKVADLLALIGVMAKGLTPEQESLISFVISDLYQEFGFTEDPDSLYQEGAVLNDGVFTARAKKRMPTFSDFHKKLAQFASKDGNEALATLVNSLKMFTRGGVYGMFDCQTPPELENMMSAPVVNFDVSKLESSTMRPIGMFIAMNWLWEKFIKKNPGIKKRVIFDEAWMMFDKNMAGYQYTAQGMEVMARRIRKRKGVLLVASQNFREFANDPHGRAVLSNSTVNFFLQQNDVDMDELQNTFHLSGGEVEFLRNPAKGQFLLRMGSASTVGQAIPFKYEEELITRKQQDSKPA